MPPRKVVREVFLIDDKFGKYKTSLSTSSRLLLLRGAHQIPHQIPLISPEPTVCPENPPPGHTYAFEIFFSLCVGIALPQLCPNVIRTVLCLITLAEEDRFSLSLNDLLQLYAVKKGRTKGTFFLSPRKGFRVFDDFPDKDEQWRKSYFFFPVNDLTYGNKTGLFVSEWAAHTDLGWESLTIDRIRASGRRIRSRTDLAVSSPPFCPRIIDKADMSLPSSRQTTNKASVSAGKKPETPTSGSGKTIKDPAGKDSEKRAADKKRKQPEETNPSPPRSSRPRHEEKGAKLKGIVKEAPQNLVVLSSRESETFESERRNVPLPAPPMTFADTMRTLVPPGSAIAPFDEMKEVNKENYLRFAGKLGKLILEFNSVFCSHEDQLSNKDVEIESFKRSEDENAKAVEKANKVMNRMKAAELQVQKLEVNNIDLTAKLEAGKNAYLDAIEKETQARADLRTCEEKMKKMEEEQAEMIAAARTDERRKVRAQFHDFSSKYGNFFKESEEVETLKVRVAEAKANRELLEEIEKGEIPDLSKELESVRADEEKFARHAAEPKTPRPDPTELTSLLADTPSEVAAESIPPAEVAIIDEGGSNKGSTSEAGIAAMFPVDVEKDSGKTE
ncbi:unnamed protein product [Arabidopsis thaliana]|uniref:Uncharacterized protein n=1 Tax=Arabidopsis thaliana TaxID=3702 RepID=A0A654ESZ4_ARATH|nr:unnamed protein product [Arabidopsis thaliana]